MRRSKTEIYLHLVWATRNRSPRITAALEPVIYAQVIAEARRLGCIPLAIGGMVDHVHLVVRIPAKIAPAELARQVKGVSSHTVHQQVAETEGFYWQEGYGAFSVSRSHLRRVIAYVHNQKAHHAQDTLWPDWEEIDEEAPPLETPNDPIHNSPHHSPHRPKGG